MLTSDKLQIEEKSARTEEDVASKNGASPVIPESSSGVTKSISEEPIKRGGGGPPNDATRRSMFQERHGHLPTGAAFRNLASLFYVTDGLAFYSDKEGL